ncbi:hypothetical protein C8R44DRAFT_750952 [Mycena epipterygia]|nr:hypothetical protein C8R44DRAFT_750952 [Mycena epipterygia]
MAGTSRNLSRISKRCVPRIHSDYSYLKQTRGLETSFADQPLNIRSKGGVLLSALGSSSLFPSLLIVWTDLTRNTPEDTWLLIDVVTELWNHHFGVYVINDAVYAQVSGPSGVEVRSQQFQAAAAVRNWRSKIGKTGVKIVHDVVTNSDDLSTIEARAEWVQNKLLDSNFVYENNEDMGRLFFIIYKILTSFQTGAYRGELVLRTFSAHVQVVSDVFYGHPVGALATTCASAERALHIYKTGTCSAYGITRKGRRSANSFVALPGIKKLFDQKWAKIMALSIPFIDGVVQIAADDTEGDESEDHRGLIQISDDSDNEAAIETLPSQYAVLMPESQ